MARARRELASDLILDERGILKLVNEDGLNLVNCLGVGREKVQARSGTCQRKTLPPQESGSRKDEQIVKVQGALLAQLHLVKSGQHLVSQSNAISLRVERSLPIRLHERRLSPSVLRGSFGRDVLGLELGDL